MAVSACVSALPDVGDSQFVAFCGNYPDVSSGRGSIFPLVAFWACVILSQAWDWTNFLCPRLADKHG